MELGINKEKIVNKFWEEKLDTKNKYQKNYEERERER